MSKRSVRLAVKVKKKKGVNRRASVENAMLGLTVTTRIIKIKRKPKIIRLPLTSRDRRLCIN